MTLMIGCLMGWLFNSGSTVSHYSRTAYTSSSHKNMPQKRNILLAYQCVHLRVTPLRKRLDNLVSPSLWHSVTPPLKNPGYTLVSKSISTLPLMGCLSILWGQGGGRGVCRILHSKTTKTGNINMVSLTHEHPRSWMWYPCSWVGVHL